MRLCAQESTPGSNELLASGTTSNVPFTSGIRTRLLVRALLLVVLSALLAIASSVMSIGTFFWRTFGTALGMGIATCVFDVVMLFKVFGFLLAKPHYVRGQASQYQDAQTSFGGENVGSTRTTLPVSTYGSTAPPPATPFTDLTSPAPSHHSHRPPVENLNTVATTDTPPPHSEVPNNNDTLSTSTPLVRGNHPRPSPSARILLVTRIFARLWFLPVIIATLAIISEVAEGRPGGWPFTTPKWFGGVEVALGVAQVLVLWSVEIMLRRVWEGDRRVVEVI